MHTRRARRIRAVRSDEPAEAISARAAALRPFLGRSGEERRINLRRMLRLERRAARCGVGYDALRHAALRRLLAEAEGPPPVVGATQEHADVRNEKGRHPR